jgi:hypothetical protein
MVCPAFATRDILPHPGRRSADPAEDLPGGGVGTALVTDSREATPCGTTLGMPLRRFADRIGVPVAVDLVGGSDGDTE